jgi:hypothetical protein
MQFAASDQIGVGPSRGTRTPGKPPLDPMLRTPPLVRDRTTWIDPINYGPCQALADAARAAEAQVIRYESVRDPNRRASVVILKCAAFAKVKPLDLRTWRIRLSATGAQAFCESPQQWIEFDRSIFATDPRIAAMVWER